MVDRQRLQLAGPVCLAAVLVCAELSARAIAHWPASSLLWYANLEVFHSFRQTAYSFIGMRWPNGAEFAQPIWPAAALAMLIGIGVATRNRLPLAIASNLSVIYSACILYGSFAANDPAAVSGPSLTALLSPSTALVIAVLLASIFSSTISHRNYWREILS